MFSISEDKQALRQLVACSFLSDFALYLIYTAIPFKALQLGAGPFELGLLAALSTGAYALLAPLCGRLSDSVSRIALARTTCVGLLGTCIALTSVSEIRWMLVVMPFVGGSLAPFWPSVQASVADRSQPHQLERNLGFFNLGWSTGKAFGFLLGGWLVQSFGTSFAFTVASCVAFAIFFVLPAEAKRQETIDRPATDTDLMAARFRRPAWVANGVAFGVGATLNHHYPRLIQEFNWSPSFFGVFLGLIFLTQTLTFVVMMARPQWWRFQRARLYGLQLAVIVAVLSLPLSGMERVLVSAVIIGVGLGNCYYSSIYYSLQSKEGRGRNAGVHESLIGLGSMLIPFMGGLFAKLFDILWAPYFVAALAVGIALLVEEVLYRRS